MSDDNEVIKEQSGVQSLIPSKTPGYVAFGEFETVFSIVKSAIFYPTFITGLSGNGKSLMVREVCARSQRQYIRLNVTAETDEDDLLGGFRLEVSGGASKTAFKYGPVITAMRTGSVLLLDEIDCGTPKLMCLQPILEGEPVYLKKTNQIIHPAPGFNIIACANTKGRGDDAGKFVGTNMLNEAFLERFAITIEQDYPDESTERKILMKVMESVLPTAPDRDDEGFVKCLVQWAASLRTSYNEGVLQDVITTRRLVLIVKSYAIFKKDRKKCMELGVARFDKDTKEAFLTHYSNVDAAFRSANKSSTSSTSSGKSSRMTPF
jgi:MoxR-like ATPase